MERVVKVLRENEAVVMVKTVVDEFEFPEYIVQVKGPFPFEIPFSDYTMLQDGNFKKGYEYEC